MSAELEAVAALLREPDRRVRLTTHRNADGDAIGSLLGLARALRALGRDVVLWHCDDEPVPAELRFLGDEAIEGGLPTDAGERTLVALDCATADRVGAELSALGAPVINVDHHHDNTRFGDVNAIDPSASSTAEMVLDLIGRIGAPVTAQIAEALYVGVVTDTGRFSYSNVGPGTFAAAADLVAAGADIVTLSRTLYEDRPVGPARLAARALEGMRLTDDGRVATALLTARDFEDAGSDDSDGVVESLRALRGVVVAALVREMPSEPGAWRVSMRSRDGDPDVSAVARHFGGGGHAAAAGCTIHGTGDDVRGQVEALLAGR